MKATSRAAVVVAALVGICASVAGVGLMSRPDGYFRHLSVSELRRYMDAAPVPPGAALVSEEAAEGHADAATSLTREYRTTPGSDACAQVVATAQAAGWLLEYAGRALDPRTCQNQEDNRFAFLVAPHTPGAPITVTWDGSRLFYILTEGDFSV